MTSRDRVDVFVSYRHREPTKSWVRDELYPQLVARFSVLLDERDFVDAAVLVDEIERSATGARVTLAVVDESYLDSGFTDLERAMSNDLVVAIRGDVERLPTAARYVDMRADGSVERLLDVLDEQIKRVFILEDEADSEWVEGFLIPALRSANVDVSHVLDLDGVDTRDDALDAAIIKADRVIVVVSSAYLRGPYHEEGRHLRHFEAQQHVSKTVPVVLEDLTLPSTLEQRLWIDATTRALWQDALRRICDLLEVPVPSPDQPPACPYPGMKPYVGDGRHPFVGRDAEIAEVITRLRRRHIATVIGPSGSGKSSLVLAGVVPHVRQLGIDGESSLAIEVIRPIDDVAHALARLEERAAAATGTAGRLLVVDQFEEAFSPATPGGAELLEVLRDRRASDPELHIIITVRADFYSELMGSPLWPDIAASRVEIPPLAGAALRRAIREPARQAGVVIDGALVERLAAETEGQPGLMPFLQEALRSVWGRLQWNYLTLEGYEVGGGDGQFGVRQAISRQANDALAIIKAVDPERGEQLTRTLLLRLVQFGEGGPHTRRQVTVDRLLGDGGGDPRLRRVFEILASPEQRIITVGSREILGSDEREDVADLSHEAIIEGWPTFAGWIEAYERLEKDRRRWHDRSSGELLTGRDLAAAELWLDEARGADVGRDLTISEFVERSRAAADAEAEEKERAAASRRRLLTGGLVAAVVVALVMAGLAIFGWWSWREAQESQRAAEREVDRRVANQLPTSAAAYRGGLALQALLVRAADIIVESDLGAMEMLTTVERDPPIERRIDATTDGVGFEAMALLDDGRIVVGDGVGEVAVWSASSDERTTTSVDRAVLAIATIPDSELVVVAGGDATPLGDDFVGSNGGVALVDTSDIAAPPIEVSIDDSPVSAVLVDGDLLYVGTWDGTVATIDISDPRAPVLAGPSWQAPPGSAPDCAVEPDDRKIRSLAIDDAGRWLAAATNTCTIAILDPESLELGGTLLGHTDKVRAVEFVPASAELLSTGDDQSIRSWNLDEDDPAATILVTTADGFDTPDGALEGRVVAMCISPDAAHVITAGRDHTVRRWIRRDGRLRADPAEFASHTTTVRSVLCPSPERFVSLAGDGLVAWDLERGNRWGQPLAGQVAGAVDSIAIRPGSGEVAVSREGAVRVHREGRVAELDLPARSDAAGTAAYSPDGRHLAVVGRGSDGWPDQLLLYDADSLELTSTAEASGRGAITAFAVADDQSFLVAMNDGELLVGDRGETAGITTDNAREITAAALSVDGHVIVGDIGGTLSCGSAIDGFRSVELGRRINELALAEDGTVAAGTDDGLIVAFPQALQGTDPGGCDPAAWTRTAPPISSDSIRSVALTRDGEILAAATSDAVVEIWDLPRLRRIGVLTLAAGGRTELVELDPDGASIVLGGEENVVVFDVDREGLRERLCTIAGRNLTAHEEESFLPPEGDYREVARCFE